MSKNSNSKNYLMQGSILAIAGLITRLIGLIYKIPLQRIIGDEGIGYYGYAYEIYNIALLLSSYSIPVAISKLVAAKEANHEYVNTNRIFKFGMLFGASVGLAASLIVFIFADKFAELIQAPGCTIPLRVLAPTIFVFSIMGIIRGLFQGKKTMVPTAVSQLIEQIFNAIGSVVAALLLMKAFADNEKVAAYGAAGGTAGTLIGAVFGLLFMLLIYSANRGYFKKREEKDMTGAEDPTGFVIKSVALTMLPIVLSQTVYQVSGFIDGTMFSSIMSSKGMDEKFRMSLFGIYSGKYKQLYNVPVAIASAFGVSIVPTLASSYKKESLEKTKEKIASSIKLNMLVAIPSAAGLGFLSKPILHLLFSSVGDNYGPQLMSLGCIAVIVFALSTLTNGVLQGIDRMNIPVIHSAISLGVHIVLLYLLLAVFDFGVYALVIGNVTYGLLVCILNWNSIDKILGYKQEIKKTFLLPTAASLIMGALSLGLYKLIYLLIPINAVGAIISIVFAVIVYGVLIVLFGAVSEDELRGLPKGYLIVKLFIKLHLLRSNVKAEAVPSKEISNDKTENTVKSVEKTPNNTSASDKKTDKPVTPQKPVAPQKTVAPQKPVAPQNTVKSDAKKVEQNKENVVKQNSVIESEYDEDDFK